MCLRFLFSFSFDKWIYVYQAESFGKDLPLWTLWISEFKLPRNEILIINSWTRILQCKLMKTASMYFDVILRDRLCDVTAIFSRQCGDDGSAANIRKGRCLWSYTWLDWIIDFPKMKPNEHKKLHFQFSKWNPRQQVRFLLPRLELDRVRDPNEKQGKEAQ